MRLIHAVRLIVIAAVLLSSPPAAKAQADRDTQEFDRAAADYDKGDKAGALAAVERILARSPDHQSALYYSAMISFQMGNVDVARGRLERLVNLVGNYFAAWELMVQVTQSQGDLARRNEAIERARIAIATAIDPNVRRTADLVRDRIPLSSGRVLSGVDYFVRGGSDFTRYQFALGDPRMDPDHGLLLRTDAETTGNWADTALMPPDKQLFHLDLVDPGADGEDKVAIYQYYVGQPNYDTVRAKVMQILRGEVKPLSGQPGSLYGILKR
jgi:tetratricopeptide (TPR) repeat protein